jgi:HPt (histidine-containing phosphotransfer) domain-containing protein
MDHQASDPIDLDHLARQTMGDADLQAEVLAMFVEQARMLCDGIMAETGLDQRGALLHRLNGSARAIGAWRVAELAGRLERTDMSPEDAAALRVAVEAAIGRIGQLDAAP